METSSLADNNISSNLFQGLKNLAEELFKSNGTQVTTTVKQISLSKVNVKSRPLLSRFGHFASLSLSCEFHMLI
jgi:hypothetical protein